MNFDRFQEPSDPCEPKLYGTCEEDSFYNCEECDNKDCEHWIKHNDIYCDFCDAVIGEEENLNPKDTNFCSANCEEHYADGAYPYIKKGRGI